MGEINNLFFFNMQDDVLGNAGLTLTVEHAIDTGKKFN